MPRFRILFLTLTLLTSPITFAFGLPSNIGLSGAIEGATGHCRGYVQTPKGGSPGTTDYERPSFEELGKRFDSFWQATIAARYNDYILEGNFLFLDPKAYDTLSHALTTHARKLPAGSPFEMQVDYDWYVLGFGKQCGCFGPGWVFTPKIEVNWLHYRYDFNSPFAQSQRAFTLITAGLNLAIEKPITQTVQLVGKIQFPLPLSNFTYLKVDIGINKYLLHSRCVTLSSYLKLGYLELDYEDEQTVPNHIRYTNFPYILCGLMLDLSTN